MRRRDFTAASAALLTAGIAGCSQSNADGTPTDTATESSTPTASEMDGSSTPTASEMDGSSTPTASETETPSAQLEYEGDTLTLENATGQELRGTTTDLEPGADLEISIDSETAGDPFVKRPQTNVLSGGRFSTTVDMSDTDEGSAFTVSVIHDDETLTEADGTVA